MSNLIAVYLISRRKEDKADHYGMPGEGGCASFQLATHFDLFERCSTYARGRHEKMKAIPFRAHCTSLLTRPTRRGPVLVCAKAFHSTTFRHNSNLLDKSSAEPERDPDGPEVSDNEWEIRSGMFQSNRALFCLMKS